MAEHVVKITVTGLSSLLMNNPASMDAKLPRKPTAIAEAAAKVYRAKNGKKDQLYVPSKSLRLALISGCRGKKIGAMGAGGMAMAGVFAIGNKCFLYDPKTGKPINEYKIHTCRAVVQKASIPRSRPEIPQWACDLTLTVDEDFLTIDQAITFLNLGGKIAGVGDYRIERKGEHGRFKAELISSKVA